MRQERKPEAGKYKHNNAEHPIWIFDRGTCSLIYFVLQFGPKRYLMPQLWRFSFVLDRIVHLPVPSESFSRHGKRFLNLYRRGRGMIAQMGAGAECFSEKSRRRIRPKNRVKSETRVKKLVTRPVGGAALC
jgi:hypothetical protein